VVGGAIRSWEWRGGFMFFYNFMFLHNLQTGAGS
jgi:hypothetical protein